MIYNQGAARRSLLGQESQNPSIAAKSMMSKRRVGYAKRRLGVRGSRRRSHKGNPAPALIGAATGILNITKGTRLKGKAALQAARVGMIDAAFNAARARQPFVTVTDPKGKAVSGNPVQLLQAWAVGMATPEGKAYATQRLAELSTGGGTSAPAPTAGPNYGALAVPLVRELGKAATRRPRAPRRQRYPSYVDRDGRQRYSYKPPGTDLRIPAGATPSPGSPYSFFRGAVGRGGVAATAGQLAVAGAAGVGAYLVAQRLLQHLGGRAQRAEEAGVNAALALREARADLRAQLGRAPTAAELRPMNDAYKAKLIELGYDPVTFTRQRSGVAGFLETYNPFGG